MRRVAILQSNYIPWKGYFDIIHDVDCFVFYDDVQFTKNDWRNRNRVKSSNGSHWLTVPSGSDINRLICEVALNDRTWPNKHWRTISNSYAKAPYFRAYKDFFEHVYLGTRWDCLSALNQFLIKSISINFLGITTEFRDSREFTATGAKVERLIDLLSQTEADIYVSGPSARDYLDSAAFLDAGIGLVYKSYDGYPEYPQLHGSFEHNVTILDLLFCVGPDAPYYIWGWREAIGQNAIG